MRFLEFMESLNHVNHQMPAECSTSVTDGKKLYTTLDQVTFAVGMCSGGRVWLLTAPDHTGPHCTSTKPHRTGPHRVLETCRGFLSWGFVCTIARRFGRETIRPQINSVARRFGNGTIQPQPPHESRESKNTLL